MRVYPDGSLVVVCPQADLHTPAPSGYLAWWEWADEMAKTHVERKCPGCGLWRIWEPKPAKSCLSCGETFHPLVPAVERCATCRYRDEPPSETSARLRASADSIEHDAPAFARTMRRTAEQLENGEVNVVITDHDPSAETTP